MPGPGLFRRRSLWVPTAWGLMVLVLLAIVAALAFGRWIGPHLAHSAPAAGLDGHGARTLVVEGWLTAGDLDAAIAAFGARRYERVVVTDGPFEDWPEEKRFSNYAERAADHLRRHGLAAAPVIAVPAPASAQNRSYLSAVMVREWAARSGTRLDAIDLFSAGVHARRSQLVFRMALGPGVEVGVLAAPAHDYEVERWWRTSAGAKAVLGETLSVAWTHCCFWPAAHGSFNERWAVPEPAR